MAELFAVDLQVKRLKGIQDFSVVFQNVVMFNNTIMENIRAGRKNATDKEVIAAAKAARCHEFIERLPQGYQTVIGENGIHTFRWRVSLPAGIYEGSSESCQGAGNFYGD